MGCGVCVGVSVGTRVEVAVGLGVCVDVAVGTEVAVAVGLGVTEGVKLAVGVAEGVGVRVGVGVREGVSVGVRERVGVTLRQRGAESAVGSETRVRSSSSYNLTKRIYENCLSEEVRGPEMSWPLPSPRHTPAR